MNIQKARQAGYSDMEIADELARRTGRNAIGARQAGYSDAEIIEAFSHNQEKPSYGRAIGIGARDVLEGIGAIPDFLIGQPFNAVNSLFGGDPNYLKNIGKILSDKTGLPKADNDGEKLASAVIQNVSSGVATMGGGLAMQGAKFAPAVANALVEAPALQISADALGGYASESIKQSGGGELAQLTAAILASSVPAGLSATTKLTGETLKGVGGVANSFTPSGRERLAAEALLNRTNKPQELEGKIARALEQKPFIEGSNPTLAEAIDDIGIAKLEKALGHKDNRFFERRKDQFEARQELLGKTQKELEQSLDSKFLNLDEEAYALQSPKGRYSSDEDFSNYIKENYLNKYRQAKQTVSDLFDGIDAKGEAVFDITHLRNKLAQATERGRWTVRPKGGVVGSTLKKMDKDIAKGISAKYKDIKQLRSDLSKVEHSNSINANDQDALYAGQMKKALDDYLESTSQAHTGLSSEDLELYKKARQARIKQGEKFEQGDNENLSKYGEVKGEQKLRDAGIAANYWRAGFAGKSSTSDFLKWADDEAIQDIKDYAIAELKSYATNPKTERLDSRKWRSWIDKHQGALSNFPDLRAKLNRFNQAQKQVDEFEQALNKNFKEKATLQGQRIDLSNFDIDVDSLKKAGFAEAHIDAMQRVQADIRRSAKRDSYQKSAGSDTWENISSAQMLKKLLSGEGATSAYNNVISKLISDRLGNFYKLFGGELTDDAVARILADAMLDPSVAYALLRRASPERIKGLLPLIEKSAKKLAMPNSSFSKIGQSLPPVYGNQLIQNENHND